MWWWNNDCPKALKEKCRLYSAKVKAKGTSEDSVVTAEYNIAKRNAKKVIGKVKEEEGRRLGKIWTVWMVKVEYSRL